MACTAKQFIAQLEKWVGFSEGNGRHKKIVDIYNSYKPLPAGYKLKYTDSWCAATVSAAAISLKATDIIPVECSCGRYVDIAKKMGIWVESDAHKPSLGEIILYDWDDSGSGDNTGWPDHIGVVVAVSGSKFTVIEGNKNDAVGYRTMIVNGKNIRGFVCPKFAKEDAKTEPAKTEPVKDEPVKTEAAKLPYTVKVTAKSGLNVRKGAGTSYGIKTAVVYGKKLTITAEKNGWGKSKSPAGWVSLTYTKKQ